MTLLRSIQLDNFKAFGQRTVVPLAPITLIFGENSSGKSSILQSLSLLKQAAESRIDGGMLPAFSEVGLADLGTFQEFVFDHDLNRTLSIRLDMAYLGPQDRRLGAFPPSFVSGPKTIGVEFAFRQEGPMSETTLEGFKLCGEDRSGFLAQFEKCDLPRHLKEYEGIPQIVDRRWGPGSLRATQCTQIIDDPCFWRYPYECAMNNRQSIHNTFQDAAHKILDDSLALSLLKGYFDTYTESPDPDFADWLAQASLENLRARVYEVIQLTSKEFSYRDYFTWMTRDQTGKILAHDRFLPVVSGWPERHLDLYSIFDWPRGRSSGLNDWSVNIGRLAVYAGQLVLNMLSALFPISPFRIPPSRWSSFKGSWPKHVGHQGELMPELLLSRSDLRAKTNEWLKRLDIGFEIDVRRFGTGPPENIANVDWQTTGPASTETFVLRLVDTRRSTPIEVELADVGFGVSQLLPVVIQSIAATDQIIAIQEPEGHVHPRLQADLGDLLIDTSKEPYRNQFLIETHSEHLALRLQRRIREGKVPADDVCILYVSRGPNGSSVQRLRLDEEGDFMDDFPGGFFPERLRELR